jgi:hypothetical protein
MTDADKTHSYKKEIALTQPRVVIVGGGFGGLCAARGLVGAPVGIAPAAVFLASHDSKWTPEKCFSFRAAYVRLYRQTVQQQERERKHENKIVRRRACCERGHDCSSEPRRCSRSGRGISQRRSCTQCPGGSRSDAARRCFIVPLNADAVTRQ